MKLLGKNNLKACAYPFVGWSEALIQLRIGPFMYLATFDEAVDLAGQLVAAVDEAKSASDGQVRDGVHEARI